MRSLAIDIESMSTAPNAALTAIGIVEFHHNRDNAEGTGPLIEREFYVPIHLASAVYAGGIMDPATVLWWMKEELLLARRKWMFNAVPIELALQTMLDWIGDPKDVFVYARGPQFDCTIVKESMKRRGMPMPWEFRNERDTRTMCKMYPSIVIPEQPGLLKHYAMDDARYEAFTVWHLWKTLNAK